MKKLLVLVAVFILVGTGSWAQDITGQSGTGQWLHDLWGGWQKQQNQSATLVDKAFAGEYRGFVAGAVTVMGAVGWLRLENTTWGQWFALVGKYLDNHPEEWNAEAVVLVYRALYAVWPGKVLPPQ